MKYIILFFTVILLSCQAFQQAPVVVPSHIQPPTSGPPKTEDTDEDKSPASTEEGYGVIKCADTKEQQIAFNKELGNYLSATIDPNDPHAVPWINCSGRENLAGGVWIKGSIIFENRDVFNPSQAKPLFIAKGSYLEIHIVGIDGALVPNAQNERIPIKLMASPSESSIQGNFINLVLEDTKGKVILGGRVNEKGIFEGSFRYQNYSTWTGSSKGYSGQMGFFSIYACDLLDCG